MGIRIGFDWGKGVLHSSRLGAVLKSSKSNTPMLRFDTFALDPQTGELYKKGAKVKLQGQPVEILVLLLQRPGETITRDELRRKLWTSDTFVDFEQGLNNAVKRLRAALDDEPEKPRFIETVPRRGYRFIVPVNEEDKLIGEGTSLEDQEAKQSLAVLPLENLSRDPEQEYLADGLTEALITTLAKISSLHVTSRTTVMQYKGIHRPVPEIAHELGVGTLIEGTVQRIGDRLRISVKLIEAEIDKHLWAESYERDVGDLLVLEAEIARAVAHEIRIKLTPQELTQLASTSKVDPDAYDAFLKGCYYWNMRTLRGYERGAEYFVQAVEKDSTFEGPSAGIAETVWHCTEGLDWLRSEPRYKALLHRLQFAQ